MSGARWTEQVGDEREKALAIVGGSMAIAASLILSDCVRADLWKALTEEYGEKEGSDCHTMDSTTKQKVTGLYSRAQEILSRGQQGIMDEAIGALSEVFALGFTAVGCEIAQIYQDRLSDNQSALSWYVKASEAGCPTASLALWRIYHEGLLGEEKDPALASHYIGLVGKLSRL